jgi:hypothetical protein
MAGALRQPALTISIGVMVALLLGLGVANPASAPAVDRSHQIVIRKSVGGNFGPVIGRISEGKCGIEGSNNPSFHMFGNTTNGRYELVLQIGEWKGFHRHYEFINGSHVPGSFHLFGRGKSTADFSNAYAFPNPTPNPSPAGGVTFRRHGGVMSVDLIGHNEALNHGVFLLGSITCT